MKVLKDHNKEEEMVLQSHGTELFWQFYAKTRKKQISSARMLRQGELINIHKHCRFLDFPEHSHDYIEIQYVISGTIANLIDGKEVVLHKGDLLFLNQEVRHSIRYASEEDLMINFIVVPSFFDVPLRMLSNDNPIVKFLVQSMQKKNDGFHYLLFKTDQDVYVENLMENMILSFIRDEPSQQVIRQYSIGLVFLHLLLHLEQADVTTQKTWQKVLIQSVMVYVKTHYNQASLQELADATGLSLSSLSRFIRLHTGHNFTELIANERFLQAEYLLETTDLSISDIIDHCGFGNASSFYAQFRKRTGMLPKEFREKKKTASYILN